MGAGHRNGAARRRRLARSLRLQNEEPTKGFAERISDIGKALAPHKPALGVTRMSWRYRLLSTYRRQDAYFGRNCATPDDRSRELDSFLHDHGGTNVGVRI